MRHSALARPQRSPARRKMSRASARCRSALVVVAGRRLDEAEAREHEPDAAPVAVARRSSSASSSIARAPSRRALGELEVAAPRRAPSAWPALVAGGREARARSRRAASRARSRSPAHARDAGLVGERVADRPSSQEISTNGCSVSSKTMPEPRSCRRAGCVRISAMFSGDGIALRRAAERAEELDALGQRAPRPAARSPRIQRATPSE